MSEDDHFDFYADLSPYIQRAEPGLLPPPAPDAVPKVVVRMLLSVEAFEALNTLAGQRGMECAALAAHLTEKGVAQMTAEEPDAGT